MAWAKMAAPDLIDRILTRKSAACEPGSQVHKIVSFIAPWL